MFKQEVTQWPQIFLLLGLCVIACSVFALAIRFSPEAEREAMKSITKTKSNISISQGSLGLVK
jgi:hypothetical protein